ncbi:MAG: acetyl-CoA carboxylase biotin carboxyl carrier protein subunit [Chloroflexi bacterium]|nr:acetyl-CoA carboxylase biotin carboxyl carrier protein subunit [Chloroflexota bacterium]
MTTDPQWEAALDEDVPRLARLLRETGAEEIEVGDAERTIRVRRSSALGVIAAETAAADDAESAADGLVVVTSEQVGVFVALSEPGAPALVGVGDAVDEGQTIGYVDVLGVAHDICVPEDGVVERLLVHDGEVVEYGQALAELRRSADAD